MRHLIRLQMVALLLGSISLLFNISFSATRRWVAAGGPPGGFINSLETDPQNPQTVYAGTNEGAYKSTNGGGSWRKINYGMWWRPVYAISVSP